MLYIVLGKECVGSSDGFRRNATSDHLLLGTCTHHKIGFTKSTKNRNYLTNVETVVLPIMPVFWSFREFNQADVNLCGYFVLRSYGHHDCAM